MKRRKEKINPSKTFREKLEYFNMYIYGLGEELENFAEGTEQIEMENIVCDVTFEMTDHLKAQIKGDSPKIKELLQWFIKQADGEKYEELYDYFTHIDSIMDEFERQLRDFDGSSDNSWDLVNQFQLSYSGLENIEKELVKEKKSR